MVEAVSPDDEEILRFIEGAKPKIFVVGTGGSGSNTISRLYNIGVPGSYACRHEHGCGASCKDKS